MATGYTREQLHQLRQQIDDNLPPTTTADDLSSASVVDDVLMAGTETGMLLRLGFVQDADRHIFINCPVAFELLLSIHAAGVVHGWWKTEHPEVIKRELEPLHRDDMPTALPIVSLRADHDAGGVLCSFRSRLSLSRLYLPKRIAAEIMLGIQMAGDRAGWWDEDMELIPLNAEKLQ